MWSFQASLAGRLLFLPSYVRARLRGEMDQFPLGFFHSLQFHIDPGSG